MFEHVADFIERYEQLVLPVERALEEALRGPRGPAGPEEIERLREELLAHLRDRDSFAKVRIYAESEQIPDRLMRQQARHLYRVYLRHQREPEVREEIRAKVAAIATVRAEFRCDLGPLPSGEAGLAWIFATSSDRELRRAAWDAAMGLAAELAPLVLDLVALRNRAARDLGFADHHHLDLKIRDLDHRESAGLVAELTRSTAPAFATLRARVRREAAARSRTRSHLLKPWHYSDPHRLLPPEFGRAPPGNRRTELSAAKALIAGLGMELPEARVIAAIADSASGPTLLDQPEAAYADLRGLSGALRALAPAVFDHYLPASLPPILRRPSHPLVVSAVGSLFAQAVGDPAFLIAARRMKPQQAGRARVELAARERRELVIRAQVTPALVRFERELYRDPGQDLSGLWWTILGETLGIDAGNRRDPAWAALPILVEGPGVLYEELLGTIAAAQIRATLEARGAGARGLMAIPDAGRFLREMLIAPGATMDWRELLAIATGRPLTLDPLLAILD